MPDTVRVRIAVCVDVDGAWSAAGASNEPDYGSRIWAEDNHPTCDTAAHVVWVEADVPLPAREERTVSGEVVA